MNFFTVDNPNSIYCFFTSYNYSEKKSNTVFRLSFFSYVRTTAAVDEPDATIVPEFARIEPNSAKIMEVF